MKKHPKTSGEFGDSISVDGCTIWLASWMLKIRAYVYDARTQLEQVWRVQVYKLEYEPEPTIIFPGFPLLAILTAQVIYYYIRKYNVRIKLSILR